MQKENRKKKKSKIGRFLMFLGALLMVCSASLSVYNNAEDKKAEAFAVDVVEKLKAPKKEIHEDKGEKYIEIDGYKYIGYIEIKSLDIELPVMAQWDYDRLKIAPCRYYGSVRTNDLVIAGHNFRSCFGKLTRLSIGDEVAFIDAQGVRHLYRVGDIELLMPYDTEKMIDSEWDLSLYTCTYGAGKRVTIRCEIIT